MSTGKSLQPMPEEAASWLRAGPGVARPRRGCATDARGRQGAEANDGEAALAEALEEAVWPVGSRMSVAPTFGACGGAAGTGI